MIRLIFCMKLLRTDRTGARLCKACANNSSANINY